MLLLSAAIQKVQKDVEKYRKYSFSLFSHNMKAKFVDSSYTVVHQVHKIFSSSLCIPLESIFYFYDFYFFLTL